MSDELESDSAQRDLDSVSESSGINLASSSSWLRVGLGLLGIVLIVVLAGPSLRDWLAPRLGVGGESIQELEQAAANNPNNARAQYQLAGAYYRARRFDEAWEQFRVVESYRLAVDAQPQIVEAEQAVQAAPSSKEAHFKLGTVWARNNLLLPAEIAFKQAIALDKRYTDAYVNLGTVYYQTNRLPDALREYEAALEISPNDPDIHHNKAAVYIQQALQASPPDGGLLNQAQDEIELALQISPDLPQAHFSLGVVYMLSGHNNEAISQFQRFLELDDGSDPQATKAAHTYLSQLGQE